jgi:hypothetical protein
MAARREQPAGRNAREDRGTQQGAWNHPGSRAVKQPGLAERREIMAISQNDPDNWPHNVYDHFPEPNGKTLNRTVFQWLTATVDRVWDGHSYGIKFTDNPPCKLCEDEGKNCDRGAIWNMYGAWDDVKGKSDAYDGYKYQPGEKVDVQLQLSERKQNDGSIGESRKIAKIRINNEYSRVSPPADDAPVEAPAEAPAAQQPVQQEEPVEEVELILTTDQKIARAQALNIIKDLLIAGIVEPTLNITEAVASQIVRDETLRLALGKHVSLDYLSSMVQVGIELGGTVTEIENKNDDNSPAEVVEELSW